MIRYCKISFCGGQEDEGQTRNGLAIWQVAEDYAGSYLSYGYSKKCLSNKNVAGHPAGAVEMIPRQFCYCHRLVCDVAAGAADERRSGVSYKGHGAVG